MPERTVDLAALEAELVSLGWTVYKRSDFPEVMLRIDVPDRHIKAWSQIHATRHSVRIADYVDSILMDYTAQQMGVHIADQHWIEALAVIRKHVDPAHVLTDNQQFLHLAAFRYALGRRTYGVGIVADELLRVAAQLDQNTRTIIVREITEADARDGLGDACDAARWREVRDRFKELGVSDGH